jgi:hypothetical protein
MFAILLLVVQHAMAGALAAGLGAPRPEPQQWVRDAIAAQGGESALRALNALRISGIDEAYENAYSEDLEHTRMTFTSFDELRDARLLRMRALLRIATPGFNEASNVRLVITDSVGAMGAPDGALGAASAAFVGVERPTLELGPERLLLAVLSAPDLRAANDTVIQGVPHHVVSIRKGSMRVYLNAVTHLPTLVDVFADVPDDEEWTLWGDVHTRTWFGSWSLEPGGVRYPRTWTIERARRLYEKLTIFRIDVNPVAPADSFAIADSVRTKYIAQKTMVLGNGVGQPTEVADGVTYVRGRWAAMIVHQPSGIVVIDSPYSSEYSARVLDEVSRRYPGEPVRALVVSDFKWAHIGGVREYVARKIPVYANARNEDILRGVASARYETHPDALSRSREPIVFHPVAGVQEIGEGPNRIQLIPVDVPGADDGLKTLVVYLPERHVLWSADLYAPRQEPNFAMQTAGELAALIAQRGLVVETLVGSHVLPTPWKKVTDDLSARAGLH